MSAADRFGGVAFGRTPDGQEARLYALENEQLRARITDYGGRLVSLELREPEAGAWTDVTLGFDDAGAYAASLSSAFGALLGRNANRIAGGELPLDGHTYRLVANEGRNTLHGGPGGFDKIYWDVVDASGGAEPSLTLGLASPDGDQGFPGALTVHATYGLDGDSLWLEFEARTDRPTVVSLSAHPYFNLAGAAQEDILDHEVEIAAEAFLPTDAEQIPTGEIRPVGGTPFDFREPVWLATRIRRADEQLLFGGGYDHCFVLGHGPADTPRFAARVTHPETARVLEIHTTEPGLQFYTGNKLDASIVGRGGVVYRQSAGFALEPQGFPDAPHHANFPSTILRPGALYRHRTRYRFLTGAG